MDLQFSCDRDNELKMDQFLLLTMQTLNGMVAISNNLVAIAVAMNISDSESDEDDEPIPATSDYALEVVPRFSSEQFFQHFRVQSWQFDYLCEKIHVFWERAEPAAYGRLNMPMEKCMLMSIWYLTNLESMRGIGDRFGCTKSSVKYAFDRFLDSVLAMNAEQQIIGWPSEGNARQTADYYAKMHNFPGIIGHIGGTHIPIRAPKEFPNAYVNRKGVHSIQLMTICNENFKILYAYTGEAGSVHDKSVLDKSGLMTRISEGVKPVPNGMHILGNMAYPLTPAMLVPYKAIRPLTNSQNHFNTILSMCRVTVERSYAILKGKFRRLKLLENTDLLVISKVILVSCVIHNMCLVEEDDELYPRDEEMDEVDENGDEDMDEDAVDEVDDEEDALLANIKRDIICEQLWEARVGAMQ